MCVCISVAVWVKGGTVIGWEYCGYLCGWGCVDGDGGTGGVYIGCVSEWFDDGL